MWNFYEIYFEEKVLYQKDKVESYPMINGIKLLDTKHSRERKGRKEQSRRVTDREIIDAVHRAELKIIKDYFNGKIPRKSYIHIVDNKSKLNLILAYSFITHMQDKAQPKDKIRLKMTVNTNMLKPHFKAHDTEKTYVV